MNDYNYMSSVENLRLAFNRICSNPEAFYKNFFRDAYQAYSSTLESNLRSLSSRLLSGEYKAANNERLFLPKRDCLIRPHALLTVEDQIVYQACANIVAEKLHPHVKNRQGNLTFGNIYAGKHSTFLYKDWKHGYRQFGKKVRSAVKTGYGWVATFDVTACYDSIDHAALRHYLGTFGVEEKLTGFILTCLSRWSCVGNTDRIELHRGIPQGPLSSGIFAELVLQHLDHRIDLRRGRPPQRRYLRYVDDIRIYGATKETCTQALISLDISARQIGLFCQGSKTGVKRTGNFRYEIKSISLPEDDNVTVHDRTPYSTIEQNFSRMVAKLILEKETPSTDSSQSDPGLSSKIKYLAHLVRPSDINDGLMISLFTEFMSDYYHQFSDYVSRYERELSPRLSALIVGHIENHDHFDVINARLLDAVTGRLPAETAQRVTGKYLKKPYRKYQPVLMASSLIWLLAHNAIAAPDLAERLAMLDWWSLKEVIRRCPARHLVPILRKGLQSTSDDVARCAAMRMVSDDITIEIPDCINESAAMIINECQVSGSAEDLDRFICESISKALDVPCRFIPWSSVCGEATDEILGYAKKLRLSSPVNCTSLTITVCRLFMTATGAIRSHRPVSEPDLKKIAGCGEVLEKFLKSEIGIDGLTGTSSESAIQIPYKKFRAVKYHVMRAVSGNRIEATA